MKQKKIFPIIFFFIFIQIIFSFFYNSQIIDQNNLLQQQQQKQQQLLLDNQKLKEELSQLTSLQYLSPLLKTKKLQPINQTIIIPQN